MSDEDVAVGRSKIGGNPDLETDFEWPAHNGTPLTFLVQFDLADVFASLGETELPSQGMLSFFYEAEAQPWGDESSDEGAWKVIWTPDVDRLARRGSPSSPLPTLGVETVPAISIPEWDSLPIDDLTLSEQESDAYRDVQERLTPQRPEHQILGYAGEIQSDPRWECEVAASGWPQTASPSEREARTQEIQRDLVRWRLLFQLDTDERAGMIWGDMGMLYFMIDVDDLREHRFENTRLVLQCY